MYCIADFCIQDWRECGLTNEWDERAYHRKGVHGYIRFERFPYNGHRSPVSSIYSHTVHARSDHRSCRRGAERLQLQDRTIVKDSSAPPELDEVSDKTHPLNQPNKHILCPCLAADQLYLLSSTRSVVFNLKRSTARSTVSSAITLYVVHFPPAIVTNPLCDTVFK